MGNDVGRRRAGRRRRPGAARVARRLRHRTGHRHQPRVRRFRACDALRDRRRAARLVVRLLPASAGGPAAAARQVARGLPWWLPVADASWQRPEGPGSHIHERSRPSGRARVVERRAGLLRLGRRCACRPKPNGSAPRAAGSTVGASHGATICCGTAAPALQRLARVVSERARADGWRPGPCRPQPASPTDSAFSTAAATSGNGARTGSAPPTTARRRRRSAVRAANRPPVDARRLVPLPRLLLQPLSRRRPQRQHAGQRRRATSAFASRADDR